MERQTDIAIIGGGLASLAAAMELTTSGLEVSLVRKFPGTTGLSSGAWDLADSPLRYPGETLRDYPSISQNLNQIIKRRPYHPFAVFSKAGSGEDLYNLLKKVTLRAAREIPLSMEGDPEENMALVTDLGTLCPAALVQASQGQGDVRTLKAAKLLILGIKGFPSFRAPFIHQALEQWQESQAYPHLNFIGHWEMELPGIPGEDSLTSVELAQALDRKEVFAEMGKALTRYLKGKVYTHLLLPPVMGIESTSEIINALQKITGLKVAETLASPMSVPGWRLSEAIFKFFRKKEYGILEGEVVGAELSQGKVKCLHIHQGKERFRLHAKKFILASGKYLSGGLRYQTVNRSVTGLKKFREAIFGLPLFCEGQLLEEQTAQKMFAGNSQQRQPFLMAGLRVNAQGQPLDREGNIIFENLYAAGRVLSGFDPSHDRCTAGVDLISGTLAAQGALS